MPKAHMHLLSNLTPSSFQFQLVAFSQFFQNVVLDFGDLNAKINVTVRTIFHAILRRDTVQMLSVLLVGLEQIVSKVFLI